MAGSQGSPLASGARREHNPLDESPIISFRPWQPGKQSWREAAQVTAPAGPRAPAAPALARTAQSAGVVAGPLPVDGSLVQTLAGGAYGFNGPDGAAFDGSRMWFANSGGNSVTDVPVT
jgi:hypothetical protein